MTDLELWAGVECSVVRVHDTYVDELALTGHAARPDDLDRLAAIGVRSVRFPLLWERTAALQGTAPDWSFADERLARLRELGISPILGLVHHGSGPPHTDLLEDSFVTGLASFARAVAERYPWVTAYTPVNEPLTTARFSALYGHWYPHARSDAAFVRALLVQCRAVRAAMKAVREVVPSARLVQTEDLGTVFSTPRLAHQAEFENERRFLSLDLLGGRAGAAHVLRSWLLDVGATREELDDFERDPCPPDLIGLNRYVTSDRFLDERVAAYPPHVRGGNGREAYADVEAVRVRSEGIASHRQQLELLWSRYGLPLALTEVHLGCAPEEQIRWLYEAWNGAKAARARGVDVRAVTVWSAFGACDWDSLLTTPRGHYEPGMFDARGGVVRRTALVDVATDLAMTGTSSHPLLAAPGWWRRSERLLYPPRPPGRTPLDTSRPVLVTGAAGTLGAAILRVCRARGLAAVALERKRLDVADRDAVGEALDEHRPWAVVNAAGYVQVDAAETDPTTCMRINAEGAAVLAEASAKRGIRYATFSSDLVFDGEKGAPYVETDRPSPLNVYGESKALAERLVREVFPGAIVARTSAFFGPWDEANFVQRVLRELASGRRFLAASDILVSPTYVPDLADAVVTLLVDGAGGTWHLASPGAITWFELARAAAVRAGLDASEVVSCAGADLGFRAPRPAYGVLESERGRLMRPLGAALALFFDELRGEILAETG
jgi:dTDP-4-dehydrorhamnose reductase